MLRNLFMIAIRNLWKSRSATAINVAGLSIGISCCIVAFLYVFSALHFEDFQLKKDRIYRVTSVRDYGTGKTYNAHTPYPLAAAMRNEFPELEAVTQIHEEVEGLISVGEDRFEADHLLFADTGFFEVFTYPVLMGDAKTALSSPNSVVLTESSARKYFGDASPLGKRIRFANRLDLQVNAVVADPPANSHLHFALIISWPMLETYNLIGNDLKDWGWTWAGATYVVLPPSVSPEQITSRFPAMEEKYLDAEEAANRAYGLQALSDIHFDERYAHDNYAPTVSRSRLWGIVLIAMLVLLTACINFINLSTAQATRRSREVGIRKVLGSSRGQLIQQFMGEAFVITGISLVISLFLAGWILPPVGKLLEFDLSLGLLQNLPLWTFLLALWLGVTALAGFYPALVLSGFQPVWALKNSLHSYRSGGLNLRRSLVVFQFVISQILIFSTLVITAQLRYFQSKDLGFDKAAIVTFALPDNDKARAQLLANELRQEPSILRWSFSSGPPTSDSKLNTTFVSSDVDYPDTYRVELKSIDDHYAETFGLDLLAGRWLDEMTFDSITGYVVNEALIHKIGIADPEEAIGKRISPGINEGTPAPILGVVRDFHNESLQGEIMPCILLNNAYFRYVGAIKIQGESYEAALARLEKAWEATYPGFVFKYQFLDEQLAENYEAETRFQRAFQLFSLIAILIGCLGLYGLVSYMALQRSKEIGIRKVMGAGVQDIVLLLSREFSLLVGIAFLIAAPLATWGMYQWLQNFAYRISIGPGTFLMTLLLAVGIAWLTVGYKAWVAARKNPADTIRVE